MDASGTPDLRLIVITDSALAAPRDLLQVVEAALEAGAPAIQLRDKAATPRVLFEQATAMRRLTERHGALLFVNDRTDVALAAGADGVHLGPGDLPVDAARAAARAAGRAIRAAPRETGVGEAASSAGPRFLVGYSTDRPDEASRAEAGGADYIGCGAVFGTSSKPEAAGERIGTEGLAAVVRAVARPVVAIGGINAGNAREAVAAGAAGVAVLGAIMSASDPGAATAAILDQVGPGGTRAPLA